MTLGDHQVLVRQIGAALDLERQRKGWTVEELARKAGTSHVTIARLVRPKPFESVGLRTISRLADALDLHTIVLFTRRTQ